MNQRKLQRDLIAERLYQAAVKARLFDMGRFAGIGWTEFKTIERPLASTFLALAEGAMKAIARTSP